jgi:hypothetical protein
MAPLARSFLASVIHLQLNGYGIQQPAEPTPLAVELLTANRGSLGAQFIDYDLAVERHIHRVDDTAQGSARVLPAAPILLVVEVTVSSSIAQSMYAVCAAKHEIISLEAPTLKPFNIRLAQLHLRFMTALLAMRATHLACEHCEIVKGWGGPHLDAIPPLWPFLTEGWDTARIGHAKTLIMITSASQTTKAKNA